MRVCYDEFGYSYDCDSGNYLSLVYDDEGFAYDAATGERVDEVITDAWGGTVYTGGGGINWNQVINTAAQAYVGGQGAAQSGKYIPIQGSESPYGYPTTPPSGGATITGGANRGGIGAGLNISTNTLMLIVGGVLLFMLGSKRGR